MLKCPKHKVINPKTGNCVKKDGNHCYQQRRVQRRSLRQKVV